MHARTIALFLILAALASISLIGRSDHANAAPSTAYDLPPPNSAVRQFIALRVEFMELDEEKLTPWIAEERTGEKIHVFTDLETYLLLTDAMQGDFTLLYKNYCDAEGKNYAG